MALLGCSKLASSTHGTRDLIFVRGCVSVCVFGFSSCLSMEFYDAHTLFFISGARFHFESSAFLLSELIIYRLSCSSVHFGAMMSRDYTQMLACASNHHVSPLYEYEEGSRTSFVIRCERWRVCAPNQDHGRPLAIPRSWAIADSTSRLEDTSAAIERTRNSVSNDKRRKKQGEVACRTQR